MRGLMAWAGAIAVAWHTVLGCCAHHSHDHGEVHAVDQLSAQGCTHGHASHAHGPLAHADLPSQGSSPAESHRFPASSEPVEHMPGGDCNEQDCVFTVPCPSMDAEWLNLDLPCWPGLAAVVLVEPELASSTIGHQQSDRLPRPWLSLRAHLALSVLLI